MRTNTTAKTPLSAVSNRRMQSETVVELSEATNSPVSYTHLTLPTIYSV